MKIRTNRSVKKLTIKRVRGLAVATGIRAGTTRSKKGSGKADLTVD